MTVNEMIYATLTTKQDKIPKYKEALEAMGYVLDNTHFSSSYDYWGIVLFSDPKYYSLLVISKGYHTGKRTLFGDMGAIDTNDIKKVDFVNLIKIHQKRERFENMKFRHNFTGACIKIQTYKALVREFKCQTLYVQYDTEKLKQVEEEAEREIATRKRLLQTSTQRKNAAQAALWAWKAENLSKKS